MSGDARPGRDRELPPEHPLHQLDDLIDEHARAEKRARRREIPAAAVLILLGATGVILGWGNVLSVFVAGWFAGTGVFTVIGRFLRDRQERGEGPRGRIRTRKLHRESATVLRQHPAREWVGAAFFAYLGVFFFGVGWLTRGDTATGSVVAVLTVVVLPFVVIAIRRLVRAHRNGVWLTPGSLTVREGGTGYRIGWDEIATVPESDSPTDRVLVLPRTTGALEISGRNRDARVGAEVGYIPIPTGALAVDAYVLVHVLWRYRAPAHRAELGTPEAVSALRQLEGARR